jgi:hypothetical protein
MKKIINNRVYDTSTAKRCSDPVDIGSIEEYDFYALTLYQKRNGEFFLFRDVFRGPLDDGIVPLSYEDARQWAESNVSANKYEELFGTVSEDDSRAAINLSLPCSLIEQSRRIAAAQNISLSAYVETLLTNALKED